ncbi:hypothetical protein ACLKA7_011500 [Drosophila subpalustris]
MPLLQQYEASDCNAANAGGNMRALSGATSSDLLQKHSISSLLEQHQHHQHHQHHQQHQHQHQHQLLQHQDLLGRRGDANDGLISFINGAYETLNKYLHQVS